MNNDNTISILKTTRNQKFEFYLDSSKEFPPFCYNIADFYMKTKSSIINVKHVRMVLQECSEAAQNFQCNIRFNRTLMATIFFFFVIMLVFIYFRFISHQQELCSISQIITYGVGGILFVLTIIIITCAYKKFSNEKNICHANILKVLAKYETNYANYGLRWEIPKHCNYIGLYKEFKIPGSLTLSTEDISTNGFVMKISHNGIDETFSSHNI